MPMMPKDRTLVVQQFGSKADWRLEKQAVRFCQEAGEVIRQVTEKSTNIMN